MIEPIATAFAFVLAFLTGTAGADANGDGGESAPADHRPVVLAPDTGRPDLAETAAEAIAFEETYAKAYDRYRHEGDAIGWREAHREAQNLSQKLKAAPGTLAASQAREWARFTSAWAQNISAIANGQQAPYRLVNAGEAEAIDTPSGAASLTIPTFDHAPATDWCRRYADFLLGPYSQALNDTKNGETTALRQLQKPLTELRSEGERIRQRLNEADTRRWLAFHDALNDRYREKTGMAPIVGPVR